MAFPSSGATLSFTGFTALVTSISVESPQAEIVDMTRPTDAVGVKRMVATGDILSPAKIRVDYIRQSSSPDPLTYQGTSGALAITHAQFSLSENAIVESTSSELSVGDLIRGSLSFVVDNS